jgi:hypothetical protein
MCVANNLPEETQNAMGGVSSEKGVSSERNRFSNGSSHQRPALNSFGRKFLLKIFF